MSQEIDTEHFEHRVRMTVYQPIWHHFDPKKESSPCWIAYELHMECLSSCLIWPDHHALVYTSPSHPDQEVRCMVLDDLVADAQMEVTQSELSLDDEMRSTVLGDLLGIVDPQTPPVLPEGINHEEPNDVSIKAIVHKLRSRTLGLTTRNPVYVGITHSLIHNWPLYLEALDKGGIPISRVQLHMQHVE